MIDLNTIQKISYWIIPVLFAITLHEAAHAFVAHRLGDSTAKMLGRLSINPLRHIDLIGTIVVPIAIAVLSNFHFVFGWAKPVPINWTQLKNPRRDMALVAAAGPLSNIVMAFFWAVLLKLLIAIHPAASSPVLFLYMAAQAGILINMVLAILNFIPIPPLDGSRVVASLLPPSAAIQYMRIEPFGFFIILALLLTGILGWIIQPILMWSVQLLFSMVR